MTQMKHRLNSTLVLPPPDTMKYAFRSKSASCSCTFLAALEGCPVAKMTKPCVACTNCFSACLVRSVTRLFLLSSVPSRSIARTAGCFCCGSVRMYCFALRLSFDLLNKKSVTKANKNVYCGCAMVFPAARAWSHRSTAKNKHERCIFSEQDGRKLYVRSGGVTLRVRRVSLRRLPSSRPQSEHRRLGLCPPVEAGVH